MKNFFKLLNFELNRFIKLYSVLLIVVFLIQLSSTIIIALNYMRRANNAVFQGGMTQQGFIDMYSKFSMVDVVNSMFFVIPMAIGVAALLFYLFFIWYRDWFARNTFIYRLLMLPTSRMNIYLSKATAIMLTVLGIVAYQIVLLKFFSTVVKWIVPKVYRVDYSIGEVVNSFEYLSIIIPKGFTEFFISYSLGFAFVVIMFTVILFERSFRLKGIVFGVIYATAAGVILVLPLIIQYLIIGKEILYPGELFAVQIVMWMIIVFGSLFVSRYLLKNKVTV